MVIVVLVATVAAQSQCSLYTTEKACECTWCPTSLGSGYCANSCPSAATENPLRVFNASEPVRDKPSVGDDLISCDPWPEDACNCVYYARDLQPGLPSGCTSCDDKKRMSNSNTPHPGCVLFRTGNPEYCHAAYVTSVSPDTVFYRQANWTPCQCSTDSLPINSDKIIGYWCP